MPIEDNNALYASVLELCRILEELGATALAGDLRGALSVSSLPGEVLGEIRLSLWRIHDDKVYSRVDVRRQVNEEIAYINKTLGVI